MSRVSAAAKHLLSDIRLFSELVIKVPLYPYQIEPLREIMISILRQEGREFLLIFPRQSGKNEAVAHLLIYLLNIFQRRGGQVVFGATGDGVGRMISRIKDRIENAWNAGAWHVLAKPRRIGINAADIVFLSTHPSAATRGETAHWLLVIDEMQDQISTHLEAVFAPMRAANNATALFIGTVRTTHDPLWQKKAELAALEAADGKKRVFIVSPETVTGQNASYGRFLAGVVAKHGRNHPIVAAEYFNEPLGGGGFLFDRRRRQLMTGQHARLMQPQPGRVYAATLDVAGRDEATTDVIGQLDNPARDYTVATIFELVSSDGPGAPIYNAVDSFVDIGSSHFTAAANDISLANKLLVWLQHWQIIHLVADESGVGAGLVDWLRHKLTEDRVTGYQFNLKSKAALGSGFLSVIETGRFNFWTDTDEDAAAFWLQVKNCSYEIPPGGAMELTMRWFVPPSAKKDTPTGREPIHDDRLVSAALVSVYDTLYAEGKLKIGSAHSRVVPPVDAIDQATSW